MHPTHAASYNLAMLRNRARIAGPNVPGILGLRWFGSPRSRVGLDMSNVPGLGGGGAVDPSEQSGATVGSTFSTQSQKSAAIAKDQANVAQAQQAVDSLQAVVDGLRGQIANVPGGVDENGNASNSAFQGMVDAFVSSINEATGKLHQAETTRNTWQAQLARDQATPVTSQGSAPAPQPVPGPGSFAQPAPAPASSASTSNWAKYGIGLVGAAVLGVAVVKPEWLGLPR